MCGTVGGDPVKARQQGSPGLLTQFTPSLQVFFSGFAQSMVWSTVTRPWTNPGLKG